MRSFSSPNSLVFGMNAEVNPLMRNCVELMAMLYRKVVVEGYVKYTCNFLKLNYMKML